MCDLRSVKYYLGVEFIRSSFRIFLSQKTYASQILEEFDMLTCTPASIPMTDGLHLGAEENSPQMDAKKFQRLVGMLIYLVNTKPEIAYTTRVLSRSMYNPRILHMEATNQVLKYIKGACDYGIFYRKDHGNSMIGFIGANWENRKTNRKSITGWIFKLVGGPIAWSLKKQHTIAISSTNVEVKALIDGI